MTDSKMNDSLIQNVSDTAFMAAAYRAAESERPDALFRDPLAALLAGERGRKIIASLPKKAFMGGWYVVIRTRVIDEQIKAALADDVDTILNLGAGLDTRPYRMAIPASLRWIEVDQSHIIELKEQFLKEEKPRCRLERIKLDISDAASRRRVLEQATAGSGKVLVLTEAVIPYLPEDAVASLARDLRANATIRYWLADYFSPEAYQYRRRTKMDKAMQSAPFLFEPKNYFEFFVGLGWKPREIRYLAEEADGLKRPPSFSVTMKLFMRVVGMFMSRERRAAMKKYTGYVLFEPAGRGQ
jgi:methyltransferase (TIGR00027 family)